MYQVKCQYNIQGELLNLLTHTQKGGFYVPNKSWSNFVLTWNIYTLLCARCGGVGGGQGGTGVLIYYLVTIVVSRHGLLFRGKR